MSRQKEGVQKKIFRFESNDDRQKNDNDTMTRDQSKLLKLELKRLHMKLALVDELSKSKKKKEIGCSLAG